MDELQQGKASCTLLPSDLKLIDNVIFETLCEGEVAINRSNVVQMDLLDKII
jgi:hypothetical protein